MSVTIRRPSSRVEHVEPDADCTVCGGRGTYPHPDPAKWNTVVRCRCRIRRMVDQAVEVFGPHLRWHNGHSPLQDCTQESVAISGPWEEVGPHVRRAVAYEVATRGLAGQDYAFRLISDQELLQASFAPYARGDEDAEPTQYDLVSPIWPLVIVRLGQIGNAHKSAPGVVWECLAKRIRSNKPTWVVVGDGVGGHSWDSRVAELLASLSQVEIDAEPSVEELVLEL